MIARTLSKDSNMRAFSSKTVCWRNMSQLIWIRRPFLLNNNRFSANLRCIRITLEIWIAVREWIQFSHKTFPRPNTFLLVQKIEFKCFWSMLRIKRRQSWTISTVRAILSPLTLIAVSLAHSMIAISQQLTFISKMINYLPRISYTWRIIKTKTIRNQDSTAMSITLQSVWRRVISLPSKSSRT